MRNYTITRIWGIPIRLNVSLLVFLPLLAWLIGSGAQISVYAGLIEQVMGISFDVAVLRAGVTPWLIGIVAAVGLFVSVTLHELGHSWVALRYGLEIESITLWILGGIAALSELPREWNREFWIAIAGPIASVLVGVGFWIAALLTPTSFPVVQFVFGWLAVINVTLVVFNLLPAFPMDGGRILRALLARNRPYASATRVAGRIGVIFAILFAIVGVLSFNVILVLLAVFVYGAATTESRTVVIDELLDGITVGDIMTRDFQTVAADATVADLAERMLRDRQTHFPVTDETGEITGIVSLEDLKGVDQAARASTPVAEVMRDAPRFDTGDDAFEVLTLLNEARTSKALVGGGGRIIGVLTETDYSHALTIQRGFQSGLV